jgi:hypothetical protein
MVIALSGIIYGNFIKNYFSFLRIWEFQNLFFLLLGIPFIFLQNRAGIPNFFDPKISNKQRFLIPVLIGLSFGFLDVLIIKIILHPEPYNDLPPFLQPFPYSVFLFFSGAFEIEVFYRLIPLTLFLLFGNWYANGKYIKSFFIIGALVTTLREPLEQLPEGSLIFITYSLTTGLIMNYLQAIYFKKFGFLASLSLRLGHYFLWHIILGLYVQFVELA